MSYLTIYKTKNAATPDLVRMAAPKVAQFLYNILRVGPRVILRSAFELLRANTVTRVLSALVLLSIDTVSLARGRISWKQYIINIALAVLLLVGGTAGWVLGSYAASFILLENMVIGIIAGLIGAGIVGAGLGVVGEKIVKSFVKDDEAEMLAICNRIFESCINARSLTDQEAREAAEKIKITPQFLSQMFVEEDREGVARQLIEEGLDV